MLKPLQHATRSHPWYLIALTIIATLSLALASPRPATTQEVPPSALASQFFTAVDGTAPFYMLSTDATLVSPEGTFTGMTSAARFGETLGASFSNLEFTPGTIAEAGDDTVIVAFTMTGINTGNYHGLNATCASIAVDAIALLEIGTREVIPHTWYRTPWEMRENPPPTETHILVTDMLVTYDSDAIERQILESAGTVTQSGCGENQSEVDRTTDPVSACVSRNICPTP